jgi:hypothetical protein
MSAAIVTPFSRAGPTLVTPVSRPNPTLVAPVSRPACCPPGGRSYDVPAGMPALPAGSNFAAVPPFSRAGPTLVAPVSRPAPRRTAGRHDLDPGEPRSGGQAKPEKSSVRRARTDAVSGCQAVCGAPGATGESPRRPAVRRGPRPAGRLGRRGASPAAGPPRSGRSGRVLEC